MSDETKPDWAEWFVDNGARILFFVMSCWFIIGFLVPLMIIYFPERYFPKDRLQLAGQFGDSFGSVNSLFTGLAFFAALMAVMMQHLELKESGKRHLEEDKFKAEEMRLANENLKLQKDLKDRDDLSGVRNCLLKLNQDVDHFVSFSHTFGLTVNRFQSGHGIPFLSLGSQIDDRHGIETYEKRERARRELSADRLSVTLILGDKGATLASLTNELDSLCQERLTTERRKEQVSAIVESLGEETKRVWDEYAQCGHS